MFKMIILLVKKDAMDDQEFARYFLGVHALLAKKMPGLRKYVANIVQRPPSREPDFHGVAELWFEDREGMKKAFASPEGEATQRDTKEFASKVLTLFADEHAIN
jgi:uncharacterized protein (TIGR02118 family)